MRAWLLVETLFIQVLFAVSIGQGWAAPCINPPASPQLIVQFRLDPQAFVAPNSDTRSIEAFVRDLSGTDPSLAADFVRVAMGTTPRFRTAIAAGLAQAAIACSSVDQQAALLIQQSVAGFQDGEFQNAFAAVAGDLSTAATNAALGSANGSAGSVVIVNPNGGRGLSTTPGGGGSTAIFQIVSSGVATPTTNTLTGTSTTAANPVSATR